MKKQTYCEIFNAGERRAERKILDRIIKRECIVCGINIDVDLHRTDWHIPLCRKHRLEQLEKMQRKFRRRKK
jgi:hypothetical protein